MLTAVPSSIYHSAVVLLQRLANFTFTTCISVDFYAELPGHLPPIFATACEFLDNSVTALRGLQGRILAVFNFESQAVPGASGDQVG